MGYGRPPSFSWPSGWSWPTSSDYEMVAKAGVIYNGLMVWGITNFRLWRTPIRLTGAVRIKIGWEKQ